jgi:hypothetical protein
LKWLRGLISELDIVDIKPTLLFQDNKSAIQISTSSDKTVKRVKHLIAKISYIKDMLKFNEITIDYKASEDMMADILTKPLSIAQHRKHAKNMGVIDLSSAI